MNTPWEISEWCCGETIVAKVFCKILELDIRAFQGYHKQSFEVAIQVKGRSYWEETKKPQETYTTLNLFDSTYYSFIGCLNFGFYLRSG